MRNILSTATDYTYNCISKKKPLSVVEVASFEFGNYPRILASYFSEQTFFTLSIAF